MEIIAFASFMLLVLAWLIAPNGTTTVGQEAAKPSMPNLTIGEAAA